MNIDNFMYQQIFNRIPAVMLVFDPHTGHILDVNQAAEKFYGYIAAELKHMKIFELNPATQKTTAMPMTMSGAKIQTTPVSIQHRLKNGEIRDVEISFELVAEEELIFASITDLTERKKTEAEKLRQRELWTLSTDWAMVGIWEWDMASDRMYDCGIWNEFVGYERDEIAEFSKWFSFMHPDDSARIKKARAKNWNGKTEKYDIEYRLRHKDGSYRWILSRCKVVYDSRRKPIRILGLSLDITDRKRMEEILQASETKLKDFAQAVPDVSFIIDEDGRYIEQFGKGSLRTLVGKITKGGLIREAFEAEEAGVLLDEVRQTISLGIPQCFTGELTFGQQQRVIERRLAPMSYLVNGKRTVAVVAVDITEQRKIEDMLQLTYELRRRSDFINDIIQGKKKEAKEIQRAAKGFGIDFDAAFFVMIIASDRFEVGDKQSVLEESHAIHKLKYRLIAKASSFLNLLMWDCQEGIGVMYHAELRNREFCKELAAQVRTKLQVNEADLVMYIGISEVQTGFTKFQQGYRQALNAAIAGRCETFAGERIVCYREAGIFQLLPGTLEKKVTAEFVERNIGAIIKYDQEKMTNFLATLEELLRKSSIREKANKLQLHPKTILFRQRRIEKLLQVNLNVDDTRMALGVAIRLKKLMRE